MPDLLPLLSIAAFAGIAYVLGKEMLAFRNGYFWTITIIALLYPFGKMMQYNLLGPGWVRWYVADVGFISSVALFMAFGNMLSGARIERIVRGIHVAFVVALSTELFQLSVGSAPTGKGTLTARGDWADVCIFIVMYNVNLYLMYRLRLQMEKYMP